MMRIRRDAFCCAHHLRDKDSLLRVREEKFFFSLFTKKTFSHIVLHLHIESAKLPDPLKVENVHHYPSIFLKKNMKKRETPHYAAGQ